jgi:choline-sulfatase
MSPLRLAPLAALFFLMTCRAAEKEPPVILISVDTLRADHLPMYGYRGISTPALDALRRDSLLFERAWSHSPLTLPSHTTILTGLLPSAHGVRDNTGFRLSPHTPTLASILHTHGYATGAAVSAFILRTATGINSGFDSYDDAVERGSGEKSLGAVQRRGEETTAIARQWITTHTKQPFFYFLHLYEPHAPYDPPEPFRSRYRSAYDGEVAYTDSIVGGFVDFLKAEGIYDRALIVFVSDHGEGLGDHGEEEHGIFLYREAISVPMIVKLPHDALAGQSVSSAVGLEDVTPTILSILRITAPSRLDGTALVADGALAEIPKRAIYSETYYPRLHFGWSDLHSLVDGDSHFIDAPRDELYDLRSDPGEKKNLVDEERRRYGALRDAIRPLEHEPAAPSAVSPEETAKLAALGYIGSTGGSAPITLADPKDKIGTFKELQSAFRLYQQHRDVDALAAFDRLLTHERDMVDLWDIRSKVLFRLGRTAEAIESGKEALRRNPSASYLAADLANELLIAGDYDGAAKHAGLAMRAEPVKAHEILARIALVRGDLQTAQSEADAAVHSPGETNAALYTLARVQRKRGDLAAVLETTSELLARMRKTQARPLAGLYTLRGDALARLGRDADAEAAFREEIGLYPGDVDAYRSLIVLLVAEGRTDEGTRAVLQLAAVSPNAQTFALIADTLHVVGDDDGARYWRARAGGRR